MAAPRAHAWSLSSTRIFMPAMSAMVCMTKGDLRAMPPMAITSSMLTPSSRKRSLMARDPKAVASTSALKTAGAEVPSVSPSMAPRMRGSRSGVRRPLCQSRATGSSSVTGSFCASSVSRLRISPSRSLRSGHSCCRGHASMRRNQAYMSPKADCPASSPTSPGRTEPSTCPHMPRTALSPISSYVATAMSQVEVPITFTSVPGRMPAPTAPKWQSMAPMPMAMPARSPRRRAHSSVRCPTHSSAVEVRV